MLICYVQDKVISLAFRQKSCINEYLLLCTMLEKETLKCQLTSKGIIITKNHNNSCNPGIVLNTHTQKVFCST